MHWRGVYLPVGPALSFARMGKKFANVNKPHLSVPDISGEVPAEIREPIRKLVTALNSRLAAVADHIEASTGARGTIGVTKQTAADPSGHTVPAIQVQNRIVIHDPNDKTAGDPSSESDDGAVVTMGFLKRYLTCQRIESIREECADPEDPTTAAASGGCVAPALTEKGNFATGWDANSVAQVWARGGYLYVVATNGVEILLQVYNVRPGGPIEPINFSAVPFTGTMPKRFWVEDQYAYAIDGAKMYIFDLTDVQTIIPIETFTLP